MWLSLFHHTLSALLVLGFFYLLSGLDDLFVDLVAAWKRLGPEEISDEEWRKIESLPRKRIAVIVPAWHEGHIIRRMLLGNLAQIAYDEVHFFVGVYPNDAHTVEEVTMASQLHGNIHPVLNPRSGPTSKGQILNVVVDQVAAFEETAGWRFDGFLLQDAEDVIHPRSLHVVNQELDRADFVQIPVYSFPVPAAALVAGTYVGEFAESHTKDLLVRQALGAAVPSAGVGTALSRRLVDSMVAAHGSLFREGALTEDYELGIRAHRLGFKPRVACRYYVTADGRREYIATREFFPRRLSRSIRQKTRWTIGIGMQAWEHLGWSGGWANRYFLMRDRKGIFTSLATVAGYALLGLLWIETQLGAPVASITTTERALFGITVGLMFYRALWRSTCVWRVYGPPLVPAVPFQMLLGNVIHGVASFQAVKTRLLATVGATTIRWVKTEHELPEFFGQPAPIEAKA